jgi:prophage regulatory protein
MLTSFASGCGRMKMQGTPSMATHVQQNTFIKKRTLADRIGISVSTLDRLVRAREFPAPVKLSANRIGFRETDVVDWQADPRAWVAKHKKAS